MLSKFKTTPNLDDVLQVLEVFFFSTQFIPCFYFFISIYTLYSLRSLLQEEKQKKNIKIMKSLITNQCNFLNIFINIPS